MQTSLAGIELLSPVYNAAGPWKYVKDIKDIAESKSGAVLIGSITCAPRTGDTSKYYKGEDYSINEFGLPNPGLEYYTEHLPELIRVTKDNNKPLFVSIAGEDKHEYKTLAVQLEKCEVDLIEINLSCPNVRNADGDQYIHCFNIEQSRDIIRTVREHIRLPIAVKVSPFTDNAHLRAFAAILNEENVQVLVTSNTIPNITCPHFTGGMSGPKLRPIALEQVRQFRTLLHENIDIVGVGGICSGKDVREYLLAGASAVQIATMLYEIGPSAFKELSL